MTQPVQEPSTNRSLSAARWGDNQLFRRPAPPPGTGTPVEWIAWQSTTNLTGSGLTTLAFGNLEGNYDNVTPTFDLSGSSPRICRGGIYQHYLSMINFTSSAGVETHFRMDLTRTAGEIPTFINYNPDIQLVEAVGPSSTQLTTPWWLGLILYSGSTVAFGTPTTLQVQADHLDDGVSVADTTPIVTLTIVRLGDAFS